MKKSHGAIAAVVVFGVIAAVYYWRAPILAAIKKVGNKQTGAGVTTSDQAAATNASLTPERVASIYGK